MIKIQFLSLSRETRKYKPFWNVIMDTSHKRTACRLQLLSLCYEDHLPLNKSGRFAKPKFSFIRADSSGEFSIIIFFKEGNLGDDEGVQVPCLLGITETKNMVEILKSKLCKNIAQLLKQ